MRRKAVIVIASLVAALATGAILAVSGGAQSPQGRTIELVTKNFRFKVVDNPPRSSRADAPPSAGDAFVISGLVTNRAGRRRGRFDATCTVTRGGERGGGVCEAIYALADGEIHLLARLDFSDDEGNVDGSIVGGTRAYAGARGTFISRDRRGERGGDPSDDTLTLLP